MRHVSNFVNYLFSGTIHDVKYHKNGKKKEEYYREYCWKNRQYNSKYYWKHGLYIEYYENGDVRIKCNYENGDKHGQYIEYYVGGDIMNESNYKNNKLEGEEISFNENGTLRCLYNYKNGCLYGPSHFYDNGIIKETVFHADDETVKIIHYKDNKINLVANLMNSTIKDTTIYNSKDKEIVMREYTNGKIRKEICYYGNKNIKYYASFTNELLSNLRKYYSNSYNVSYYKNNKILFY